MGYQPGREWWELVVAMRKVAVVAVGTFGTLLGVVDLQAFIALAIVFVSVLLAMCFIGKALRSTSYNKCNVNMLPLSDCHPGAFGGPAF
jgi:hypothetical protein